MRCPYCNEPSMLHVEINLCVCAVCKLTAPRPVFEALAKRRAALVAIDAIRNDIIGRQTVGWSRHVYPLVSALEDAGFKGLGYEAARQNAITTDDTAAKRVATLEAEVERWVRRVKELEERAERATALLGGRV